MTLGQLARRRPRRDLDRPDGTHHDGPPHDVTHHDQPVAASPIGRRRLGLLLGPVLLVGVELLHLPLTRPQQSLVAILCFAMTYWALEAIPVPATALAALALCVLLNVPDVHDDPGPAAVVFTGFSSSTVFLLIGGFILARAMIKHGLNRRIALRVLSLPGVATSTTRVIIAFGLLGAVLSAIVANGAVATMLLPITVGIDRSLVELIREHHPALRRATRLRFSTALMLMTAYGITVGGLLTPIGDPSNLIGRAFIERQFGTNVGFGHWMALAAPIVAVLFTVLCPLVLLLNPPELRRITGTRRLIRIERAKLGAMSRGERNTLAAFLLAIVLWVLPTLSGLLLGVDSRIHHLLANRVDEAVAALIAATLLFVLPVNWFRREFTLTWRDAGDIDWGTILLIGTGLTLGQLMLSTKLAFVLGTALAHLIQGAPHWMVFPLVAATAILISEITSNTASVGIVVPIMPALAMATGTDPVGLALVAVFAATYGFMLPISTSANAIAYSSGKVPVHAMLRSGLAVDLSGVVLIAAGLAVMLSHIGSV